MHSWLKNGKFIIPFLLFLFFIPSKSNGQDIVTWDILSDITFEEKFDEATQIYWLIPTFGRQPKMYENQTVIIEGFFIPVNMDENFHVLSKFPFAACFFCGAAGPESIVEIQLDKNIAKRLQLDQKVRVEGKLLLNGTDYDHCNYILESARPLLNNR